MKRTPLKRKKPKSKTRSWFVKELDRIAKTLAKERDGYVCQKCGEKVCGSNAHGSHVIPVSAGQTLRWDLDNIKCLCMHDHIYWWHKNPLESSAWFRSAFPERYEYLQSMRNLMIKFPTTQLEEFHEAVKGVKSWEKYKELYKDMMA